MSARMPTLPQQWCRVYLSPSLRPGVPSYQRLSNRWIRLLAADGIKAIVVKSVPLFLRPGVRSVKVSLAYRLTASATGSKTQSSFDRPAGATGRTQ